MINHSLRCQMIANFIRQLNKISLLAMLCLFVTGTPCTWGAEEPPQVTPASSPIYTITVGGKDIATELILDIGEVLLLGVKCNGEVVAPEKVSWELNYSSTKVPEQKSFVQLIPYSKDKDWRTTLLNERKTLSDTEISAYQSKKAVGLNGSWLIKGIGTVDEGITLEAKIANFSTSARIKIRVENDGVTLALVPVKQGDEAPALELGTTQERRIQAKGRNGGTIDLNSVAVTSKSDAVEVKNKSNSTGTYNPGDIITLTAKRVESTPVEITISAKEPPLVGEPVRIVVFTPTLSISPISIEMRENQERVGKVTLGGYAGVPLQGSLTWFSSNQTVATGVSINNGEYTVKSAAAGKAVLTARYTLKGQPVENGVSSTLQVEVRPRAANVAFDGNTNLLLGRTEEIKILLKDAEQNDLERRDEGVFNVEITDSNLVTFRRDANRSNVVFVTGHAPGRTDLIIKVDGAEVGRLPLSVATVSEFKPIRVALNLMDEKTATDLFGKQTSKEFYAVRVRLFNNLDRSEDGRFLGQSILAYSESIEASVGIKKLYDPKLAILLGAKLPNDKAIDQLEWQDANPTDGDNITPYLRPMANVDNPYPVLEGQSAEQPNKKRVSVATAYPVLKTKVGNYITLKQLSIQNNIANENDDWWSSAPDIAYVDSHTGVVKGIKEGKAIIWLSTQGRRFARVVSVGNHVSTDTTGEVVPVVVIETGGLLNLKISPSPAKPSAWAVLEQPQVPDGTQVIDILPNSEVAQARGRRDGYAALLTKLEGDSAEEYAVITKVDIVGSRPSIPPSVYLNEKGEPYYFRHNFRYRPYTFEMMVNSLESRNDRSARSKTFRIVDGLVSLAAAAAIGGGSDARSISAFSSLVVPSARGIFPDMSAAQRQNFVSMAMKPLEEIPFGSDISRVLFFPKSPFHGMIDGYWTRISRIDTSFFNITVALLNKKEAGPVSTTANTGG